MNEILLRVFQMKDEMPKKEKAVADALLRNPNALISRSITEYAQFITSSTATITRFCRRIGLSGFSELRLSIAKNLSNEKYEIGEIPESVDLSKLNSTSDIMEGVITNAISSINQLHEIITQESIERAAALITSCRHVMLCGVGASALVARDLHQKLVRLGILSHFEEDLDLEKVQLASFNANDVVIAFSYSGNKAEVKELVKLAKAKEANIISVTKLGNTPIAQMADINLTVAPTEALVREGATVSRLQMLIVVDMLFQVLISRGNGVLATLIETWNNVYGNKEEQDNND